VAGAIAARQVITKAASRTEPDTAVRAIGLTALLSRLGGYDAQLDPAALSAGERKLIALTRAYLSAASVVILDEAACHLDPAAEQIAEDAFARRGGTLIVIAHRITSALRARRILVLDGTRAHAGDHVKVLGDSVMTRSHAITPNADTLPGPHAALYGHIMTYPTQRRRALLKVPKLSAHATRNVPGATGGPGRYAVSRCTRSYTLLRRRCRASARIASPSASVRRSFT
jgi:energy-coupling factor transporter ATP-binding protein EcfA2